MKQALDADDRPWQLYICIACGLIYNEEEGDPDGGLPPGTRFEDIPDDWECPDCGVTKKDFKPFVKRQFKVASSPKRLARKGIVVVGAGMAGWAMVEAIRDRDPSTPITVITSCDGHRYNKPRLSVSFSQAEPDSEFHLQEDALQAAQRLGVTLIERTFVISVSSASKQVRTTRGTYPYTQLIIAQGSQTALPASLPEHLCWRINRLSDWNALNTKLGKRPHRIALVGAGMVGCELAEDLSRAGHTVFLLSRHDRPLNSLLPKKASSRLLDSVKKNGITFIPSANIQDVVKAQDSTKVLRWDDTEELEVDEIIATTGVVTANRIAKSSGLAFDNGIVVNPQTLSTSTNDIYAIGDCITLSGRTDRYIEPIEQQAAVVADAIATDSRGLKYQHNVSTVALKTKSLPIVMQGRPDTDATWEEIKSNDRFLLMEQRKNGDLIATLRVGTER